MRGRAAAGEALQAVIEALPGLSISIGSWAGSGDAVFIEFVLRGDDGTSLPMVDRFELRGDRGALRLNYLDLTAVAVQTLRRPALLRRFRRLGVGLRGAGPGLPPPMTMRGPAVELTEDAVGFCRPRAT